MTGKSRWADKEEDKAARKREKEEKKRSKQRKLEEAEARRKAEEDAAAARTVGRGEQDERDRPTKRRKLSPESEKSRELLRFALPGWGPCRHVSNFERLNHIEGGSYGSVSRARETATAEVVALKELKMENQGDGFPVTALREIQILQGARHKHIVDLREVVVGDTLDDVFLVMEFLEHDLMTLQEDMDDPFLPSEVKTLMLQITSAVEFLHDHWILHRDLKTSNILLNNRGEIKLADFGMARYFGDPPPPNLTQHVVTLWYRAPELLLGADKYNQSVDIWSLGCIFGELLKNEPLFPGNNEIDQITQIFKLCGLPTESSWPSFRRLPNTKALRIPKNPESRATRSIVRSKFPLITNSGAVLLEELLALNPTSRPSASEILTHPYFKDDPRPKASSMFPTFPSRAGMERKARARTPEAPRRGQAPKLFGDVVDFRSILAVRDKVDVTN